MNPEIKKGVYQHYKGNKYEVIGLTRHTETEETMVIYTALYESEFPKDFLWARPLKMFKENVNVDGKTTPRFLHLDH